MKNENKMKRNWKKTKQQWEGRDILVLVAEDVEINRIIVEAMLSKDGHTVVLVNNGIEAVEAVERDDFDVVVMDIRMPVMSGIEAAQRIRMMAGGKSRIPIVALTADVMEQSREACLSAGINAFVTKPIEMEALNDAIRDAASSIDLRDVG